MKKINADRFVSISAIIVSIGTLVMILYQTSLTRKQQRASVMPSLEIGYSVKNNDSLHKESIWIANKGLGPAFIEKVSVVDNEQIFDIDPYGFISKNQTQNETTYFDRLYSGRIIPANDGITTYEKTTDSTSQIVINNLFEFPYGINNKSDDKTKRAVIVIEYRSIYGEKWKVRSDKTRPIEID